MILHCDYNWNIYALRGLLFNRMIKKIDSANKDLIWYSVTLYIYLYCFSFMQYLSWGDILRPVLIKPFQKLTLPERKSCYLYLKKYTQSLFCKLKHFRPIEVCFWQEIMNHQKPFLWKCLYLLLMQRGSPQFGKLTRWESFDGLPVSGSMIVTQTTGSPKNYPHQFRSKLD